MAHFPAVTVNDLAKWKLAGGVFRVDEAEFCFKAVQLTFPKEAVDFLLEQVSRTILLPDGSKLARLCCDSGVGTCWCEAIPLPTRV